MLLCLCGHHWTPPEWGLVRRAMSLLKAESYHCKGNLTLTFIALPSHFHLSHRCLSVSVMFAIGTFSFPASISMKTLHNKYFDIFLYNPFLPPARQECTTRNVRNTTARTINQRLKHKYSACNYQRFVKHLLTLALSLLTPNALTLMDGV